MKRLGAIAGISLIVSVVGPIAPALASPAEVGVVHGSLWFVAPKDRPIRLGIFTNANGLLTFKDGLGRISAGEGCEPVSPREVTCGPSGARPFTVVGSPFGDLIRSSILSSTASIDGAGGSDELFGGNGNSYLAGAAGDDVLHGWQGSDYLAGGAGNDTLFGGLDNDTLIGGAGDDRLVGGGGDDRFDEGISGTARSNGADILSGGTGIDTASYARTEPVTVSLDDVANDGAVGERDDVRSNVERVGGGAARDVLIGNDQDNVLTGWAGSDRLIGGGGDDELFGRQGNDHLYASDGVPDRAVCGDGTDVAVVDPTDHASASCETVHVT